jgi:hypothetical protein
MPRSAASAAKNREYMRRRRRIKAGIEVAAPLAPVGAGKWRDPEWQCLRCTDPHAPGSDLCWDHQRTMAELAEERKEE